MAKGDYPTKDRKFLGQKYTCAICGMTYHKYEMVKQRGYLVCKETCWDKSPHQWAGTEQRG